MIFAASLLELRYHYGCITDGIRNASVMILQCLQESSAVKQVTKRLDTRLRGYDNMCLGKCEIMEHMRLWSI